jgi:pimeloyl-ACP methyl ester carboxylesterase
MPHVRVGEQELHYERRGEGPLLLLIQGMSGTHVSWGEPFRSMLEREFEVVAFDNRGIGLSGPVEGPFTIAEMAADTVGLMDELGMDSAHVVAISMGGMIAQELALAHPGRLRTLTLGCTYCGGPGSKLMPAENAQKLAAALSSGDREQALRASWEVNLSPGFRAEEDRYGAFREMALAVPVARRTIQLQMQAILGHDTSSRLGEVEAPTLIVHGDADGVLPVENGQLIASLMPEARLETLPDVGHMFWWEQPQRAAQLVREHALGGAVAPPAS